MEHQYNALVNTSRETQSRCHAQLAASLTTNHSFTESFLLVPSFKITAWTMPCKTNLAWTTLTTSILKVNLLIAVEIRIPLVSSTLKRILGKLHGIDRSFCNHLGLLNRLFRISVIETVDSSYRLLAKFLRNTTQEEN